MSSQNTIKSVGEWDRLLKDHPDCPTPNDSQTEGLREIAETLTPEKIIFNGDFMRQQIFIFTALYLTESGDVEDQIETLLNSLVEQTILPKGIFLYVVCMDNACHEISCDHLKFYKEALVERKIELHFQIDIDPKFEMLPMLLMFKKVFETYEPHKVGFNMSCWLCFLEPNTTVHPNKVERTLYLINNCSNCKKLLYVSNILLQFNEKNRPTTSDQMTTIYNSPGRATALQETTESIGCITVRIGVLLAFLAAARPQLLTLGECAPAFHSWLGSLGPAVTNAVKIDADYWDSAAPQKPTGFDQLRLFFARNCKNSGLVVNKVDWLRHFTSEEAHDATAEWDNNAPEYETIFPVQVDRKQMMQALSHESDSGPAAKSPIPTFVQLPVFPRVAPLSGGGEWLGSGPSDW
eukprot:Platyproteum_vivax@DN28_c0_g1_i1.p1